LRIEKKHGNPKIEIKIGLRVNKCLEWTHTAVIQTLSEFDIWIFEQLFNDEFDKRGADKGWVLQNIIIIVRSKHIKAVQIYQSIDNFSVSQ